MKSRIAKSTMIRPLRHGRITIPKAFREALGIGENDLLRITLTEGKLEIAPVKADTKIAEVWMKRLYELFAPVRESLREPGEGEIDRAIEEVVRELRKQKRTNP